MKILVSNDDGILARGIEVLEAACRRVADVTVVAPDRQQSAASHSLTMFRPLRPTMVSEGRYQLDGTPTDCVLLALELLFDEKPAFVFSGVNHGPNMGEDVLYSGTVAAAMEGLSLGIPGVALSFAGEGSKLIPSQKAWVERLVASVSKVGSFPRDTLLNVNFPPVAGDQIKGVRVTTLGRRMYSESLTRMKDPWGRELFWIGGGRSSWSGRDDSDFRAVAEGYISVTPLHFDLTNYELLETVRSWNLAG